MTKKLCLFSLIAFVLGIGNLDAQDDTWTSARITDEMTVNPEQNQQWRMGQTQFSAKPKNAWEVGLSAGHFLISGDVPADIPAGFGIGAHLRKSINYTLSWRLEGFYSSSQGLDGRITGFRVLNLDNDDTNLSTNTYRNFRATNFTGAFSAIINIGNLLFHQPRNKWNAYVGLGVAITSAEVQMDYLNGNSPYNWSSIESQHTANSREKRRDIRAALDGEFDHFAENNRNVPSILHDNGMIFPSFLGTVGISRKINKRFNLSLEHQVLAQDFDKWDGHEWREADSADGGGDQSNSSDIASYTTLKFGINLGNFDNVTEPMYWLNPLDATYNDIAELKRRPALDLTDSDGDGVIDMLDQEIDSPAGCPVDTRGVVLDSDGDGLPDCKDMEPFSPPGYETDQNGVAQIPQIYMTESDVNDLVNSKIGALESTLNEIKSGCGEWFLPMIHFDLDQYFIKPEFFGQLHHVAEVLKRCPNICITVEGHTDTRSGENYNNMLSYNRANAAIDYLVTKYGIPRERLKLMFGGENVPLASAEARGPAETKHYMNRRVEFRVCADDDYDMERPEGPNAGQGAPVNSNTGNKSSGY